MLLTVGQHLLIEKLRAAIGVYSQERKGKMPSGADIPRRFPGQDQGFEHLGAIPRAANAGQRTRLSGRMAERADRGFACIPGQLDKRIQKRCFLGA